MTKLPTQEEIDAGPHAGITQPEDYEDEGLALYCEGCQARLFLLEEYCSHCGLKASE